MEWFLSRRPTSALKRSKLKLELLSITTTKLHAGFWS